MTTVQTGYKKAKGLKTTKKYKTPEERGLFAAQEEEEWRQGGRRFNNPGEIVPKGGWR